MWIIETYHVLSSTVRKKSSQHWIVIGAITLSYFLYVAQEIIHWYTTQQSIVSGSETRDTLFVAMTFGPGWNIFVNDICTFLMGALADGLLVREPSFFPHGVYA